jgi:MerR family mercuric resistance operon transcriptional regulator
LTRYYGPEFIFLKENAMSAITTAIIAEQAGVNIETIRYYERRGLIEKPPRNISGYRQFPEETVERIRFIKNSQRLGFSLREIRDLLSLKVTPKASCADVKRKTDQKILEIEERIYNLQQMKQALQELSSRCLMSTNIKECHILNLLEKNIQITP